MQRGKGLPDGQPLEEAGWRFTFGGGYTLLWGFTDEVKLYGLGGRPLLAGSLTRAERATFGQMECWRAGKSTSYGGDLYLSSITHPAGAVDRARREEASPAPAGRCAARGAPSPSTSPGCASPTAASLETGWVDHLWALPDDALNAAAFPPGQAGITVAVAGDQRLAQALPRDAVRRPRALAGAARLAVYLPARLQRPDRRLDGDYPVGDAQQPRNCPPTSASGKR